nr:transporter [Methylorubrum salsuginis]
MTALTGQAAFAASAAQPGQTIGVPFGAPFPKGFYAVNLSSFGVRDTAPLNSESNVNLPTLLWATPFSVLGGQVQFIFVAPIVASSVRGAAYNSGWGQPLLAGQLAWDLGSGVGVSYLLGGYLPWDTRFLTQSASLSHRFAITYAANDWAITGNLLYGHMLESRSPTGVLYPDYLNLDVTLTKKFGKWQVGPVAFASTDLPTNVASYRQQGQIAVGGLVGYNFGFMNVQGYVTRDVVERNYGGLETRGWLRVVVPFGQDKGEAAANRTLVTRQQAQGR